MALVHLFRIPNCVALGLLFLSSRRHYGYSTLDIREILLAVTWVLLAAFSYTYNDLRDIAVDRINKPDRPIPSGTLSIKAVKQILIILGVLIICLAIKEWQKDFLWPIGALLAGLAYSRFLRARTAFGSNLTACCLVAAVPLSGLPLRGNIQIWALAIGIMLLMFGRELQKDALDAKGDVHFRPVPLIFGKHSRIFQFVYPFLLLLSAVSLYSAIHTTSDSLINKVSLLLLIMIHSIAIIVYIFNKSSYQAQADITKLVSYSLVVILAVGN